MNQKYTFKNGYTINRVINGCWQLSQGHTIAGNLDFSDVKKAFYQLLEQGFTTFDCADIYTGVEEFIGSFIAELRGSASYSADSVQVHTKYVPDLAKLSEVDFNFTEAIIDRSLKRLNKDSLDLVQFHWWDYDVPGCIETAGHLKRIAEKGKIRNIAGTNFDTENLKKLIDAGVPIVSNQIQYSLFDRRVEKTMQKYCAENDVALLCYGTLSGGFLSEKWIGKNIETIETRSQTKYLQVIEDTLEWDGYQQLLGILKEIAEKYSVSISNVATKYILNQSAVAGAIVGVRNSRHVASNKQIFDFELSSDDLATIKSFIDKFPNVDGEPFTLERTVGSKYRGIMKMNINNDEQSN